MSACATTAVWSALQKVRDHQNIATFTPAQITTLASKYSLPFGRSMPSEGLSIDQMCQAVQAMGVSPNVYRVDRMEEARGCLYSAIKSGFPPILVLSRGMRNSDHHAVACVGMKLARPRKVDPTEQIDDISGDLIGVYIHDDRRGPYLRAYLKPKGEQPQLHVDQNRDGVGEKEIWDLKHVIVPTPSKIRVSLPGLREAALHLVKTLHAIREFFEDELKAEKLELRLKPAIAYEYWIVRSHKYIEDLVVNPGENTPDLVQRICASIPMSRHIGLVSVSSSYFDTIDLLVDVTGTQRNAHCLGVCAKSLCNELTETIVRDLAKEYRCPSIP